MKSADLQPEFLADPFAAKDACGVGLIASRHGKASHAILEMSFEALANLVHRGAVDADGKTGDGAGLMTGIPREFYVAAAREKNVVLSSSEDFGIAMVFFPQDPDEEDACRRIFKSVLRKNNIPILWERDVPVNDSVLGQKALSVKPKIAQLFLGCPRHSTLDEFEQNLYFARKEIEVQIFDLSYHGFYVASMSARTIVHKGLFLGNAVKEFYLDLAHPDFVSNFAIFHQRFSTNTFPSWPLAHPFRMLAHNGEINTIRGNRNWMRAREAADQQGRSWVPEEHAVRQLIMQGGSDSASFDNALEAYAHGGRTVLHSVVHMMPEAWQRQKYMDPDLKAFYEYHACVSELWGGPAAIAFCDGKIVGALLDRNGFRPARYKITKDFLVVCSEAGCVTLADETVEESGKLSPGKIIALNLKRGKILKNDEIKSELADHQPYADWIKKRLYKVETVLKARGKNIYHEEPLLSDEMHARFKVAFGYSQEDLELVLNPMFKTGHEAIGSMGDDTPLSVFSKRPKLLYTYFRQLFAQVTNPPIDPIRERYTTSIRMYLGKSGNVFEESAKHAHQMRVRCPIATRVVMDDIRHHPDFPSATLMAHFKIAEGAGSIDDVLWDLCLAAEKAVDTGKCLIILSDRYIDADHAPIPMLLAVAAVHNHLLRVGKRLDASLLVETAEARETHHFACLIGYGASVIYPYVALAEAVHFARNPQNNITPEQTVENYINACEEGLLKILSKMGISVLQSYHAAQIFEVLGLKNSLVKQHFGATPSKVSGVDASDIAMDYIHWHREAFESEKPAALSQEGFYRFRREGEYHAFNPALVKILHKAVMDNDETVYAEFAKAVNEREPMTLRDLLVIKKGQKLPVENIEEASSLIKRFCTPGISYGAISKETHETFAIAMNRIGAKSDSGEGGEDPARFRVLDNGDSTNSAIKQVASGRFGVTAHYLSMAHELEIKIAQGAKPGEGGQLPGHKVSADIARVRHATKGVTMISPAPHHDIYSIEDLAQLIYDLKQSNPKAKVCVKLVAEDGVGTIAAGVAKAHADVILISGHDGGTGASPLSSIKYAGLPWELGISEAQQVLVKNNLRDRVILRADGGFKTGLDVVKAALLGAEEFGFGTASLIAVGCVMVRQCHLNTCPAGIATQDETLRQKYKGTPDRLINYFMFIAREVREILAEMGFKTLGEIIGRVDLLEQARNVASLKARKVNLSRVLANPDVDGLSPLKNELARNDWQDDESFDVSVLPKLDAILKSGTGDVVLTETVRNVHRSIGARLSYEIVSRFGPEGLPKGKVTLNLTGTAGQSFGVFGMKTLELNLVGEANDYVGKGLSGAVITLRAGPKVRYKPEDNVICGNTCLYGATSGKLFVNGQAGERFAVRNSGAFAVVEGVGDHACEYMTGGTVVVLGTVGFNFGAGMTGGVAFVYDLRGDFKNYLNPLDVEICAPDWESDDGITAQALLREHAERTGSLLAKRILQYFTTEKNRFVCVMPKEILKMKQARAAG